MLFKDLIKGIRHWFFIKFVFCYVQTIFCCSTTFLLTPGKALVMRSVALGFPKYFLKPLLHQHSFDPPFHSLVICSERMPMRILLQVYKNICNICWMHLILLCLLYLLAVHSFDVDWYILSLIINTISFLPRRLKCKSCRFLQLYICRGSSNVREVARHDGSIIFLSFRFTEAILLLSLKLSGKVAQPLRQRYVLFLS